jgi:hypothetical protein
MDQLDAGRSVSGTHLIPDTACHGVGEIIEVFIIHLLGQGDQFFNRLAHGFNFLVGASAAFTINTFIGALTIAWFKFHIILPLRS